MLKERRAAAERVAKALIEFEIALDEACRKGGELYGAMPAARLDANLSALFGQEAFEDVAEGMAMLTRVRGRLVAAHKSLDRTKAEMGLGAVAFGPGMDKPAAEIAGGPTLRAISA